MKHILLVPGSLREASSARATARALERELADDAVFSTADIGLLPHYNGDIVDDPAVAAWKQSIAEADGVVFVTPEYNYSLPGVLKNAIDWASRPAFESVFAGKPCAVVSVSAGALGGVRAQSHLKYVLHGMLARVFPMAEIVVPAAGAKVRNGILEDDEIVGFAGTALRRFIESF